MCGSADRLGGDCCRHVANTHSAIVEVFSCLPFARGLQHTGVAVGMLEKYGIVGVRAVLAAGVLGVAAPGCSDDGRAPVLEAIDDQVAAVGVELVVNLRAQDPDGDTVQYLFDSQIEYIKDEASIAVRPDGTAVFRWTPLGTDVGSWPFDFIATDGRNRDVVTATIEVRSTLAGAMPVFRDPLGSGTTLDLNFASCLDLSVVVEDQDDAAVTIGQQEPVITGASLVQETGLSANWSWCPSPEQLDEDRYHLVLSADDGDNEKVLKNYLVVLRLGARTECPGKGPTIEHEPQDVSSILDVRITAEISDDLGLKNEPLLYYSLQQPEFPIDFGALETVTMEQQSGDNLLGIWTATIPNPVAEQGVGASAQLFYIISASDDDDPAGSCDHVTDLPLESAFAITVTNPGGEAGAAFCEACSADVQCGGAADLCVDLGDETACLRGCEGGCPEGASCEAVASVDGANAMQCRPAGASCAEVQPTCTDDAYEENDSRQQASAAGAVALDAYTDLVACPGDEDWYRVDLAGPGILGALIDGGAASDLDLGIYTAGGDQVALSVELGSGDVLEECLEAGVYFVRVFSLDDAENTYDMLLDVTPGDCAPTCVDDGLEPDDTIGQATYANIGAFGYISLGRTLCSGDSDFFELDVPAGQTIVVDLSFTHVTASDDLDLHVFDSGGVDLTPCSVEQPAACSVALGQSATSDEHLEWPVAVADTYYIAVQGYGSAENDYGITIDFE